METRQVFRRKRCHRRRRTRFAYRSMTNTDTRDVAATLAPDPRAWRRRAADIVRVSVYDAACAEAVRPLVDGKPCAAGGRHPFRPQAGDPRAWKTASPRCASTRATSAARPTCAQLADCLKTHRVPVRIGRELRLAGKGHSGQIRRAVTPQGMVESALRPRADAGAGRALTTSCFPSRRPNVRTTVEAYRLAARADATIPLHIGVTEAGHGGYGHRSNRPSASARCCWTGIGDTMRVSFTGDPVQRGPARRSNILRALRAAPRLCGRHLLPHLRAHLHRRGRASPQRVRRATQDIREPAARGGDGLRRQRPGRGARGRPGHRGRQRRRRAVRKGTAAARGARATWPRR